SMRRFGSVARYSCAFALVLVVGAMSIVYSQSPPQAPTGFATPTLENSPGSQSTSNGMMLPPGETFANAQAILEGEDGVDGSLGPVYKARGCVDCHQNPVTGGASQVTELRVGHRDSFGNFVNPTITINNGANSISNRSLVNDRAVCPQAPGAGAGHGDDSGVAGVVECSGRRFCGSDRQQYAAGDCKKPTGSERRAHCWRIHPGARGWWGGGTAVAGAVGGGKH